MKALMTSKCILENEVNLKIGKDLNIENKMKK